MKIIYDHQIFWYQKYGGISKYFAELMNSAKKNNLFDFDLSTKFSNNKYIENKSFSSAKQFFPEVEFTGKRTLFSPLNYLNQKNTLKLLNSNKFDLFHPTYFQDYYLNKTKIPFVLTVHDLTMEKFNKYFSKKVVFRNEKYKLFKKSNRLITVSKKTKHDLIEIYDLNKNNIDVVYHGVLKFKLEKIDNLPKKYILFVGGRGLYKNFDFFVKSISKLLIKDKDLHLICVGEKFSENELKLFNELKISNKLKQISATESELAYLYKNAKLFVFPSLYEGFGLPILEAMQYGCPVALSNASCFPEIAQNSAVYFDPKNKESILESVSKVLYEEKKRNLLIKRGLKREKDFSWDKCAKETKKVYEKAIK